MSGGARVSDSGHAGGHGAVAAPVLRQRTAVQRLLLLAILLLAGCAQPPAGPEFLRDTVFETIPDRSVIYVVRTPLDSREASGLILDEKVQFTTLWGTYYRWEVAPGTHRVAGFASANESVTLTTGPGGIYFLEHTVRGSPRGGVLFTSLRQIDPQRGRALVAQSQLRQ